MKKLTQFLHYQPPEVGQLGVHSIPMKISSFIKRKSLDDAAENSHKLTLHFPLRFFSSTVHRSSSDPKRAHFIVREGLSRSTQILASLTEQSELCGSLTGHQKYKIIALIPFHIRSNIFWELGHVLEEGVQVGTITANV